MVVMTFWIDRTLPAPFKGLTTRLTVGRLVVFVALVASIVDLAAMCLTTTCSVPRDREGTFCLVMRRVGLSTDRRGESAVKSTYE